MATYNANTMDFSNHQHLPSLDLGAGPFSGLSPLRTFSQSVTQTVEIHASGGLWTHPSAAAARATTAATTTAAVAPAAAAPTAGTTDESGRPAATAESSPPASAPASPAHRGTGIAGIPPPSAPPPAWTETDCAPAATTMSAARPPRPMLHEDADKAMRLLHQWHQDGMLSAHELGDRKRYVLDRMMESFSSRMGSASLASPSNLDLAQSQHDAAYGRTLQTVAPAVSVPLSTAQYRAPAQHRPPDDSQRPAATRLGSHRR